MAIQAVSTFLVDGKLHYLDPQGNLIPIAAESPVFDFGNVSREVSWRLRGTDEKPDLGDGRLIANLIKVGSLWLLQITLKIGTDTTIPTEDGWIFATNPVLHPAIWVVNYDLGGFGLVSMDSRDNGSNAGPYWGMAEWKRMNVDGVDQPVISLKVPKTTRPAQMEVIHKLNPFDWLSAEEGGSVLSLSILYEGNYAK